MRVKLSDESKTRILEVRRNQRSMEELTLEELDGMTSILETPLEDQAPSAAVASESTPTEDGGTEEKTPSGDTSDKKGLSRKELFDEINRLNQTLNALPGKLKHNPTFRKEFAETNKLEDILLTTREAQGEIDLNDPHMTPTERKLAEQLLALTTRNQEQETLAVQREVENQLFSEIDMLVASNPELSPKNGTWRSHNANLTKAFEAAGQDINRLNDPAFKAELEKQGIAVPTDANFMRLTEIHAIKQSMQISASDAYSIWKGRNPDKIPKMQSAPATGTVVVESDRVGNLLGSNASAQGGVAPEAWSERLNRFARKHDGKMDFLNAAEAAEWQSILDSEPKK